MSWANKYIDQLDLGNIISFRPYGNSMSPRIESGQLCTVSPDIDILGIGDVVLCKVHGKQYLHLIKDIKNNEFQIGNNKGSINGWIAKNSIYGKLIKVSE